MARGDKNYDKVARGQKNKSADSKKKAIHKMVEALIAGDSDAAAEELHKYLQLKTRDLILGEEKEEKEEEEKEEKEDDDEDEDESEDDDDDDDDDDEDEKKGKKKKLKEANDTQSRKQEFHPTSDRKIHGNSLRDKPKKSNDTKAKAGLEKKEGHGDTSSKGNVYKKKPHKQNLTGAKAGLDKMGDDKGVQKDKVEHRTDGRDYDMGTGNV